MSHSNSNLIWENWTKAIGMNLIQSVEIKVGTQTVHCMTGIDEKLHKIREFFDELEDVHDVFEETKHYDIGDHYICYKEYGEYGTYIGICENTGKNVFKLFLNKFGENGEEFMSTFYNTLTNRGLEEKHYSNRVEHYINGVYHSLNYSDEVMKVIRKNTRIIFEDRKYPTLYKFIKNPDERVIFLPKREMDDTEYK